MNLMHFIFAALIALGQTAVISLALCFVSGDWRNMLDRYVIMLLAFTLIVLFIGDLSILVES